MGASCFPSFLRVLLLFPFFLTVQLATRVHALAAFRFFAFPFCPHCVVAAMPALFSCVSRDTLQVLAGAPALRLMQWLLCVTAFPSLPHSLFFSPSFFSFLLFPFLLPVCNEGGVLLLGVPGHAVGAPGGAEGHAVGQLLSGRVAAAPHQVGGRAQELAPRECLGFMSPES